MEKGENLTKLDLLFISMFVALSASSCLAAPWTITMENGDLGNISSVEGSPHGCIANVHYQNGGHPGVYKIYYGFQNEDDGCSSPFDEELPLLLAGLKDLPHPYQMIMRPVGSTYVNSEKMIFQDQITKKTMTVDEFEGFVRDFETQKAEAAGDYSGHPWDRFVHWAEEHEPLSDPRQFNQRVSNKSDPVIGSAPPAGTQVGAGVTVPVKQ